MYKAALILVLLLAACVDLPRPFQGAPGATAMRLAQPPPARIAVTPGNTADLTLYAQAVATALQEQEVPAVAETPRPGDWRLQLSTEQHGGSIILTFSLIDPSGKEQGQEQAAPIPSDAWRQARSDTLKRVAAEAAPRIATLLARVEAARRQSDPRSLTNRPGRTAVTEVTGAPGDGNSVLARLMRDKLSERGQVIQESTIGVDFTVKAVVTETPVDPKTRRIEIVWRVTNARNEELGKIVQTNDIPAGTLDRYWGDVAVIVTEEASAAIRDMILTQTGGR